MKKIEKRKGPDLLSQITKGLSIISWIILFFLMVFTEKAKPEFETFFDRFWGLQLRTTWDMDAARIIFYLMLVGLLTSVVGILLSRKRYRRKSDRYPFTLVLIGSISLLGLVLYLLKFRITHLF